jgi:hypothetical protein
MASTTATTSTGIGFFSVLFLVLLVLKLTGYITWSWWMVTAPIWGPWVLFMALAVVFYVALK